LFLSLLVDDKRNAPKFLRKFHGYPGYNADSGSREHALLKELLEQLHKSRIGEGERNECDGDEKIHLEM